MIIKNIQDLTEYILNNSLTDKELGQVVFKTLRVWVTKEHTKKELVQLLIEFHEKFPDINQRPFILEDRMLMPEGCDNYLDEHRTRGNADTWEHFDSYQSALIGSCQHETKVTLYDKYLFNNGKKIIEYFDTENNDN